MVPVPRETAQNLEYRVVGRSARAVRRQETGARGVEDLPTCGGLTDATPTDPTRSASGGGAILAAVLAQPVVERLGADAEDPRGLALVAAELVEGGEDDPLLGLGQRLPDAQMDRRTRGRRCDLGQVLGKPIDGDLAIREDVGPLDGVAQLAHIARPALLGQVLESLGSDPDTLAVLAVELGDEMQRQVLDVALAFAQRR